MLRFPYLIGGQIPETIIKSDGEPNQRANRVGDGSVFTTATNGGIRVGVSIGTFVKKADAAPEGELAQVHYREFRGSGASKRQQLAEHAVEYGAAFVPKREHRYVIRPIQGEDAYWSWPSVDEMFPAGFNGINTSKDEAVTSFSKQELRNKFQMYLDSSIGDANVSEKYSRLMQAAQQFENPSEIRQKLFGTFEESKIREYAYRPFNFRWLYNESKYKLI